VGTIVGIGDGEAPEVACVGCNDGDDSSVGKREGYGVGESDGQVEGTNACVGLLE